MNILAVGPLAGGYVTCYRPGPRPATSSLNFAAGQTIANAGFVQVGYANQNFVVRLFTSTTTHLVLDVTGATVTAVPGPAAPPARRPTGRRLPAARRVIRSTQTYRRVLRSG